MPPADTLSVSPAYTGIYIITCRFIHSLSIFLDPGSSETHFTSLIKISVLNLEQNENLSESSWEILELLFLLIACCPHICSTDSLCALADNLVLSTVDPDGAAVTTLLVAPYSSVLNLPPLSTAAPTLNPRTLFTAAPTAVLYEPNTTFMAAGLWTPCSGSPAHAAACARSLS